MPCLLKERTGTSPGIVSFTHNEALWGPAAHSHRVRSFLEDESRKKHWLFGVHVQGDLTWLEQWPVKAWQSFYLWPDRNASFLANVPRDQRLDLNCINFMPIPARRPEGMDRNVDIVVISRPSSLKRIIESLEIIRRLFELRPGLTVTIVAGDPRRVELGTRAYGTQNIDRRFFEFAAQRFTSRQLAQISFLSTSEQAFGRFPIARPLMDDIMRRSRFMMLTSHQEGTPRVIAEAFLAGTPCILSEKLRSGILSQTNANNTLFIPDDIDAAVVQIDNALSRYEKFSVDIAAAEQVFGAENHVSELRDWLSKKVDSQGMSCDGRWFLDDLHLRLACHAQRVNPQVLNSEKLFFAWFDQVTPRKGAKLPDPYDEDSMFGGLEDDDRPRGLQRPAVRRAKALTLRALRKFRLIAG